MIRIRAGILRIPRSSLNRGSRFFSFQKRLEGDGTVYWQLRREANYSSPYSAEAKERVELYLLITIRFHTLPRESSAFQISALGLYLRLCILVLV